MPNPACTHEGIGLPGCRVCDLREQPDTFRSTLRAAMSADLRRIEERFPFVSRPPDIVSPQRARWAALARQRDIDMGYSLHAFDQPSCAVCQQLTCECPAPEPDDGRPVMTLWDHLMAAD